MGSATPQPVPATETRRCPECAQAVWWLYFSRSRRVRATYLVQPEALHAFD